MREADTYRPLPLNTSHVALDPELSSAIERLAEHVHDLWAAGRMAEGWTYGDERSDARKTHPGLVPFDSLPEREKQYDRRTAAETLKSIVALGFHITPPDRGTGPAASSHGRVSALVRALESERPMDMAELSEIWRARDERTWRAEPAIYTLLAQRFLSLGDPIPAHEVLAEATRIAAVPDLRREHLLGLALARSGALEEANAIARRLQAQLVSDPALREEVLGLLGRTHKDLALRAERPETRRHHLASAYEAYLDASREGDGSYPLVNAAAMALLLDRAQEARSLADEARRAAHRELRVRPDDYWARATLGETALMVGDEGEAERHYRGAVELAGRDHGRIVSTRRQALLIAAHRGPLPSWISTVLKIPRVVAFAGHLIDLPGRLTRRLPPAAEGRIKDALRDRLSAVDAGFGYSAAACGSDLLFLEAMADRGAETHVVLPYPSDDFIRSSVDVEPAGRWLNRFRSAVARAAEVVVASESASPHGTISFEYGSLLMLGLALTKARFLETEVVPMAIWDEGASRGTTAAIVGVWRAHGYDVQVIPPSSLA